MLCRVENTVDGKTNVQILGRGAHLKLDQLSFHGLADCESINIHADASDFQLGGVIAQQGKPIAFYSRKLNRAQRKCTTMEPELLLTVKTLREYKNILLG